MTSTRCKTCNGTGSVVVMMELSPGKNIGVESDCPDCDGQKAVDPQAQKCVECGGSGSVVVYMSLPSGRKIGVESQCDHCNGSGLEPLV